LEDLEGGSLEYETVGKFLANIKKEFREKDKETVKVVELKRLEQGGKIIEEFVEEFRRAARGSRYKGSVMVCLNTNIFLFLLFISLDLIFDDEEACD